MAITKELLSSDITFIATEGGAAWLESKLVPKYADSVTRDSETNTVSVIRGGITLLRFSSSSYGLNVNAFYAGGFGITKTLAQSGNQNQYGFTTKNGVVVCQEKLGQFTGKVIFTLDNNGDTIVILSNNFTQSQNHYADVVKCGITVPAVPAAVQLIPIQWTSTQIVPFPVYDPNSEMPVYTPNCFYMMTRQFDVTGEKAYINGVSYLCLGGWLLKNE